MVQKICNPVKGHGCLSTSCGSLNYHDFVLCIADNSILLLLDSTDNIFELHISAAAQFCLQDFIVNLHITLKLIDQFSLFYFILPLRGHLPVYHA